MKEHTFKCLVTCQDKKIKGGYEIKAETFAQAHVRAKLAFIAENLTKGTIISHSECKVKCHMVPEPKPKK